MATVPGVVNKKRASVPLVIVEIAGPALLRDRQRTYCQEPSITASIKGTSRALHDQVGSSQTCRRARPDAQAQLSFVLLPRRQLFAKLSLKAFIKKLDGMKFFQRFFAVAGPKVSQAQRIVSLRAVRLQLGFTQIYERNHIVRLQLDCLLILTDRSLRVA